MSALEADAPLDVEGGFDPQLDFMLPGRPDDPRMRDSVSMWISPDDGAFGLPRFCIEAVGSDWDNRGIEANIAFPDGRVLIGAGGFAPSPTQYRDGKAVSLSAGPLTFELMEPLRRWRMTFDGEAVEGTVARQVQGDRDGLRRHVRVSIEALMAAPPWTPGEQAARAGDQATSHAVGAIGGHRHEQLFRCFGRLDIDGEPARPFIGTGLRVRRYGVRDVGEFPGHIWHAALFPSGKAFGVLAFPPRADGTPAYNEAFVFENGRKRYARLVDGPWMTTFTPHDGPLDLVLETDAGPVRIEGRTHDSVFIAKGDPLFGDWSLGGRLALPFHQGGARYTWDGETTYGMVERSLPADRMSG